METDFALLLRNFQEAAIALATHHPRQHALADQVCEAHFRQERIWMHLQNHARKQKELRQEAR